MGFGGFRSGGVAGAQPPANLCNPFGVKTNRLVLRRLDSNGSVVTGGVSDLWLGGYDGINPTLALSSLSSSAVTNRYLWGPGVDFLLADEQLSPAASPTSPVSAGNTLWPLGDHLGTLRDLADFSGTAFTITNHRVFDTFGRLTSETNSAVDSHFAFTGKFFDDLGDTELSTSLSHHWNRWYDPQLGKWLSEDPIGFAGGDVNLGRYVGNHATGAVDANGLFMDDPALGRRVPPLIEARFRNKNPKPFDATNSTRVIEWWVGTCRHEVRKVGQAYEYQVYDQSWIWMLGVIPWGRNNELIRQNRVVLTGVMPEEVEL
ncbi:MAG: RHS repeat domain-containing protein, partial [Planctomycetota bacterium]